MGPTNASRADKFRELFSGTANPSPASLRRFYDFAAHPTVLGPITSVQADDIAQALARITKIAAGRSAILDLGCGAGYMSTWLALQDESIHVVGVDCSAKMIKSARRHADRLGIKNVRFFRADIEGMLPEGAFDCVIDSATLQYVENLVATLTRVRASMAPDGILISAPQLGTAREARPFVLGLKYAGFGITEWSYTHASDLGHHTARPMIVASPGGPAMTLDLDEEFSAVRETLSALASKGKAG